MTVKKIIGTAPSQVPRNKDLGSMAYQDAGNYPIYVQPTFRNRIINGNMRIWQRGTSFGSLGSPFAGGTAAYSADRWHTSQYQATNLTVSQVTSTGLAAFPYAIRVQRPSTATGGNEIWLNQPVEIANCYDLAGQYVTLSFYVRTGTNFSSTNLDFGIGWQVTDATSDAGMDYNYFRNGPSLTMTSKAMPAGTGWTYITQTYQVPTPCYQVGVFFGFTPTGTAGASDYIEVTGVQLEKGSVATPFEYRPYGTELALCQRYYEKSCDQGVLPSSTVYNGCAVGIRGNGTFASFVRFSTVKRATPTITMFSTGTGASGKVRNFAAGADENATSSAVSDAGFQGAGTTSTISETYGYQWTASAEL